MPHVRSSIDVRTLKGLTQDSRQVQEGYLFAALSGAKEDGARYIKDALARGASVVLAQSGAQDLSGPIVYHDNPRRELAYLAAEFYGAQPENVVAVGGTNGKTSTVYFIRQLWEALGYNAAFLGTLGTQSHAGFTAGSMTTPDPVTLHHGLSVLAGQGVTHLAIEASSHGLDQYRLDGVQISVGGFTSFSRDHMDYHGDMQAYLDAKARLFSEVIIEGGYAVLNADIPEYDYLAKLSAQRGLHILSYGFKGRDLTLQSLTPLPHGQKADAVVFGRNISLELPVVGAFQAMNILCALGCVMAHAQNNARHLQKIIDFLPHLSAVPGRLQRVSDEESGLVAYVDYAHTPDALDQALKALRPHTKGRLFCVFGCGGDRDAGKRYVMGEVAVTLSDGVVVTDDNPRSEDPQAIRNAIMQGTQSAAQKAHDVSGRREAILFALSQMQKGDVLLLAGKGHEQGQIFNGYTEPFDDVSEVQKAMRSLVK